MINDLQRIWKKTLVFTSKSILLLSSNRGLIDPLSFLESHHPFCRFNSVSVMNRCPPFVKESTCNSNHPRRWMVYSLLFYYAKSDSFDHPFLLHSFSFIVLAWETSFDHSEEESRRSRFGFGYAAENREERIHRISIWNGSTGRCSSSTSTPTNTDEINSKERRKFGCPTCEIHFEHWDTRFAKYNIDSTRFTDHSSCCTGRTQSVNFIRTFSVDW